ncbi:MAG: RloB family protein [bacterium]
MPKKRDGKKRKSVYKKILILCEGEQTEVRYFNSLKGCNRLTSLHIIKCNENTPVRLVNQAVCLKKLEDVSDPYNSIWVIFDKDNHTDIERAFIIAYKENINIIYSNRCFEYWYLLHFEYTTRDFLSCKELIKHLEKYLGNAYNKSQSYFDKLQNKLPIAMNNATKLRVDELNINEHIIYERELNEVKNKTKIIPKTKIINNKDYNIKYTKKYSKSRIEALIYEKLRASSYTDIDLLVNYIENSIKNDS